MIKKQISIINKLGLHARAAAKFVNLASKFDCEITLIHKSIEVNGKSIMGIMMLAAAKGTTLELRADGEDEEQAIQQLAALIDNRFDEDE